MQAARREHRSLRSMYCSSTQAMLSCTFLLRDPSSLRHGSLRVEVCGVDDHPLQGQAMLRASQAQSAPLSKEYVVVPGRAQSSCTGEDVMSRCFLCNPLLRPRSRELTFASVMELVLEGSACYGGAQSMRKRRANDMLRAGCLSLNWILRL